MILTDRDRVVDGKSRGLEEHGRAGILGGGEGYTVVLMAQAIPPRSHNRLLITLDVIKRMSVSGIPSSIFAVSPC